MKLYVAYGSNMDKETIEVEQVMECLQDPAHHSDIWIPHSICHGLVYIMTEGSPYGSPSRRYIPPIYRAYLRYGMDPRILYEGVNYSCDCRRRQETCAKKE